MSKVLPSKGAASPEVMRLVANAWKAKAKESQIDVEGLDINAPLSERLIWALAQGLTIGCILCRYSSKLQHSTTAQAIDCAEYGASHKIYIPPEYVCVDEAQSGRKVRRDGLDRVQIVLDDTAATVLLVFKVSRIFRKAYKGLEFFTEKVVEKNKRAISISQGIDTDEKEWKLLAYMHGMSDELLLDAIADHVRSGLKDLFRGGYVTGPLTVGYEPVEVPNAPPTSAGKPRTCPAVVGWVGDLIRQHFTWIAEGMKLREGWRRWIRSGGPKDPRSTSPAMTYSSYRRMLSNPRYTGRWAFGRKRSRWSHGKDYNTQVVMPETEVTLFECDELRIVSDELFHQVQLVLSTKKGHEPGPRRTDKVPELWDLVTDCFLCQACTLSEGEDIRMYQCGANGGGMRCKRDVLCSCKAMVRRSEAVKAVCDELAKLLERDVELIADVFAAVQTLEAAGDPRRQAELDRLTRRLAALKASASDYTEMLLEVPEDQRSEMKARIVATYRERSLLQVEHDRLQKSMDAQAFTVNAEEVRTAVVQLSELLTEGAAGRLGADVVHRAAMAFRMLVGGRILVVAEPRPGRKTANIRGLFTPFLLQAVKESLDDPRELNQIESRQEVSVWLREPPPKDRLALIVHELIDVQKLSFRGAEPVVREQGFKLNKGSVWQAYRRYYEMIGQPVPKLPYNNGNDRASR